MPSTPADFCEKGKYKHFVRDSLLWWAGPLLLFQHFPICILYQ